MNAPKKFFAVMLLSLAALALLGRDGMAEGITTELPASKWPTVLDELKDLKVNRAPYHVSYRSRAYDHDVIIRTPMSRAALYVQMNQKDPAALTQEAVTKAFDPSRLVIQTKTLHRAIDHAQNVEIQLLVDGKVVYPVQDHVLTVRLRSVGFYAEPLYEGSKEFVFDTADFKTAKTLVLIIVEPDDSGPVKREINLDMGKLR